MLHPVIAHAEVLLEHLIDLVQRNFQAIYVLEVPLNLASRVDKVILGLKLENRPFDCVSP